MFFRSYHRFYILPVFLCLLMFDATAQSRQALEEQRMRALGEIEETSRFLNETQRSQKKSLEKLNLLNAQAVQLKRLISGMNAEIAYIDKQIGETNTKVSQMTAEIEKMKAEYAQMVFQAYKNRGNTIN
jgi:septal ring factor EnvC (AmiA/AmiB activator)